MAVKPDDILPDSENIRIIDGVKVRKGSIAAVIANISILESDVSATEKSAALEVIKELAPALIVLDVYKHVTFKNLQIQELFDKVAKEHETKKASL